MSKERELSIKAKQINSSHIVDYNKPDTYRNTVEISLKSREFVLSALK